MKNITIQEACKLLKKCTAILWNDTELGYPVFNEITGKDENRFLSFEKIDGDASIMVKFFSEGKNKGTIRSPKIDGNCLMLIDDEDEGVLINLLTPMKFD